MVFGYITRPGGQQDDGNRPTLQPERIQFAEHPQAHRHAHAEGGMPADLGVKLIDRALQGQPDPHRHRTHQQALRRTEQNQQNRRVTSSK